MDILNTKDRHSIVINYIFSNLHLIDASIRELLAPLEQEIKRMVEAERYSEIKGVEEIIFDVHQLIENHLIAINYYPPNTFDIVELTESIHCDIYFYDSYVQLLHSYTVQLPASSILMRTLNFPLQDNQLHFYKLTDEYFIEKIKNLFLVNNTAIKKSVYEVIYIDAEELRGKYFTETKFDLKDLDTKNLLHVLYITYIVFNGNKHFLPPHILKVINDPVNEFEHYIEYTKDYSINILELMTLISDKLNNK